MDRKEICILGAGLTGLSAAWHLSRMGIANSVYEKESSAGGLCRSKVINGFTFDCDGHLLHFKHDASRAFVTRELGLDLASHERSAWICSDGVYSRYPFQAHLYGLSPRIIHECISGFIHARGRKRPCAAKKRSFSSWSRSTFGTGICRHFMHPYNRKFWTVDLDRIRSSWVDGFIPVPTIRDMVSGAYANTRKEFGYNAMFWYPRKGGIIALADAFANGVRSLSTGAEAIRLDLIKRRVFFKNGIRRDFRTLILTLPLPEIVRLIPDLPDRVRAAARKLAWTSILNINIGMGGRHVPDKHWVYFPHRDTIFFRAGFYHNFSPRSVPPGASSMYMEISYSRNRPLNKKRASLVAAADAARAGILPSQPRILASDVNDIEYGYIINDNDYDAARRAIIHYLHSRGVIPAGRYGAWRYFSMEDAILDGKRAAIAAHRLAR